MMGWCIGILLLIVGFVLFMIPGSQTIGWILWMAGIVCFGGQGFINYRKSSNPTEGMAASSLRKDEDHTENAEWISKEVDNKKDDKKDAVGFCCQCGNPISADDVFCGQCGIKRNNGYMYGSVQLPFIFTVINHIISAWQSTTPIQSIA